MCDLEELTTALQARPGAAEEVHVSEAVVQIIHAIYEDLGEM